MVFLTELSYKKRIKNKVGTVTTGNQTWGGVKLLKGGFIEKVYKLVVYHIVCYLAVILAVINVNI